MSAVTDMLDRLVAGSKTVEEVAEDFRQYAWPVTRDPAATGEEAFTRSLEDPETPVEGSFFDVSHYHASGQITDDQYDVLAEAAAEAMRAGDGGEDDDEPPAGGVDPDDEDDNEDETVLD